MNTDTSAAKAGDYLDMLCNTVALAYHEARNVRHLIRKGVVDKDRWRYLVSLPTNRDDAWREIADIRLRALSGGSVDAVLRVFENRFHVSLQDLAEMFSDEHWRHAKLYGGNAWAAIVGLTVKLANGLRSEKVELDEVLGALEKARHNTGSLFEKLDRLEKVRAGNKGGL